MLHGYLQWYTKDHLRRLTIGCLPVATVATTGQTRHQLIDKKKQTINKSMIVNVIMLTNIATSSFPLFPWFNSWIQIDWPLPKGFINARRCDSQVAKNLCRKGKDRNQLRKSAAGVWWFKLHIPRKKTWCSPSTPSKCFYVSIPMISPLNPIKHPLKKSRANRRFHINPWNGSFRNGLPSGYD